MTLSKKDDTSCVAALESAEQSADRAFDPRLQRVEDPTLARLRQTLAQLPPAVSWEEIRSQILAALAGLPEETQASPPLAGQLSPAADIGRREDSTTHELAGRQQHCRDPKSQPSGCPQLLSHLPRARRIQVFVWGLAAVMLVIAIPLVLRHRNTRNTPQHLALPVRQNREALPPSPQLPLAQMLSAPSAAGPAMITAVQPEFTPASASVVIALTAPVEYEVHRLAKPERVYIDFHETRLPPWLKGGTVVVSKPCLLKYRLAARAGQMARIAFETGTTCDYSARLTAAPSTNLILLLRPIATAAHR